MSAAREAGGWVGGTVDGRGPGYREGGCGIGLAGSGSANGPAAAGGGVPAALERFSQAVRHFEDVDALLEELAGAVADEAGIGRLLVFLKSPDDDAYRLRQGIRNYLDGAPAAYGESEDLPLWLRFHAHIVCRAGLSAIAGLQDRVMLAEVLASHAAEALVPLFGRQELLGWLLVGRRLSGRPYTDGDLLELQALAGYMAVNLENAMLHRIVGEQRALTGALIGRLSDGIVAVDRHGYIRWANLRTFEVLALPVRAVAGLPVECLGGRVADALRRCLADGAETSNARWVEPATSHPITLSTRRLGGAGEAPGAMAVIRDLHRDTQLRLREARVERKAFYQGLAEAIGHEIRNALTPLVPLLHTLRSSGSADLALVEMADTGAKRLQELPALFDRFADIPDPVFQSCGIEAMLEEAVRAATAAVAGAGGTVHLHCESRLPAVDADHGLLCEGFGHLLVNAMEALGGLPEGKIDVTVRARGRDRDRVLVVFEDNGPGLCPQVAADPFSPFATTKRWPGGGLRHVGLGLPVARRVVQDHGGEIDLHSDARGVRVVISLPVRRSDSAG